MRQASLFWIALPRDEPVKAGRQYSCRFAELHGFDVAGRYQFIEFGSTDANHASGLIDLQTEWFGWRLHHRTAPSSRNATGSAIHRLMADSYQPVPWMLIGTCRGNVPSLILR